MPRVRRRGHFAFVKGSVGWWERHFREQVAAGKVPLECPKGSVLALIALTNVCGEMRGTWPPARETATISNFEKRSGENGHDN